MADYKLFLKFADLYKDTGFKNIDSSNPLMIDLEKVMKKNKQFFYIIDFSQLNVIYSSSRSLQMLGLKPEEMNPRNIFIKTHPEEVKRHSITTTRALKQTNEVFSNPEVNHIVMSTTHNFLTQSEKYQHQMIQSYVFKNKNKELNVYGMNIHTDISWFKKKIYGFNNYIGMDLSKFRFPDKDLILEGCVFSKREFEIIKLVKEGFSSDQISKQIFLSHSTIKTHRRNILKKTNHTNIRDLIVDLVERGVL